MTWLLMVLDSFERIGRGLSRMSVWIRVFLMVVLELWVWGWGVELPFIHSFIAGRGGWSALDFFAAKLLRCCLSFHLHLFPLM